MDNMLTEAAPHLKRRLDSLNADPLALNCRNGTLRFVRVEDEESDPDDPRFRWFARLDPHEREDWITKLCEAEIIGPDGEPLQPSAKLLSADDFGMAASKTTPVFTPFVQEVQPELAERQYLQRLAGYCLTGLTSEQMIGFWYGIGANGKSTFADLVARILNDLAVTLSIDSFTGEAKRDGASATPDLVRLNGANLCFANEGEEGVSIKEGLVKTLTGGDTLPVRKMREEFVEIRIKAKFIIITAPQAAHPQRDDGIWRRLQFLEWRVQIPPERRDKQLPQKLLRERNGVLRLDGGRGAGIPIPWRAGAAGLGPGGRAGASRGERHDRRLPARRVRDHRRARACRAGGRPLPRLRGLLPRRGPLCAASGDLQPATARDDAADLQGPRRRAHDAVLEVEERRADRLSRAADQGTLAPRGGRPRGCGVRGLWRGAARMTRFRAPLGWLGTQPHCSMGLLPHGWG